MVRHPWLFTWRLIAALAVLLAASARAGAEPPEPRAKPDPPDSGAKTAAPLDDSTRINIFLNGPADLESIWKLVKQPDFILLKGGELNQMLDRARGQAGTSAPAPAVVDSVAVEGTVGDDLARLTVELGITLASDGPAWVPIRLDDVLAVTDAREGDRLLPLQVVGAGWQVELRGKGAHAVRVELKAPTRATADGRQVGFAIPEAASTRFHWDVAQRIVEATAGPNEPVDQEPVAGGSRTWLAAHLTPRARLDVSWRAESQPGAQLPPLLSIQGEIAIDIDPSSFRTRSTWSIHSVRGSPRILYLLLDPNDEVLELKLDGQDMPAGIETIEGETRMAISLTEPLRPGAPRSLIMTTRRPIPATVPPRLTFQGFPLLNAREQSGAIGIVPSGNLGVVGTPVRGLRQIDPRTELPADLRARPGTELAYQFVDQPFELKLRVDSSPPLVHTEDRTTIVLDAGQARVDSWLDYQTAHGRLFDVRVGLPRGLELESVGPKEAVESSQLLIEPGEGPASVGDGTRVVTVRLTPKAQESNNFSLHLTARQAIDPARPVSVALFQPRESTSRGGRVAVLADRNLTVDLRDQTAPDRAEGIDAFRPAALEPPADWPWPADRSAWPGSPALWLRHDDNPSRLPLAVTIHPRTVTSETTLLARIDRRGVEIEQEIESTVHFGTVDHLDIEVPAAIQEPWELEGGPVSRRENLGVSAQGGRRYRLKIGGEVTDRVKLRFRFRLARAPHLLPEQPAEIAIPWMRPVEGTSALVRATIAAEPAIGLDVVGTGWVRSEDDESTIAPDESGLPVRLALAATGTEPAPLRVVANAHALTSLPPLIASRLWLRTVQGLEGDLRTSASYWVETHQGSLSIALPAGADWVRAKVAGEPVAQVEPLPKGAGYRIVFPARLASGPVAVELEYTAPNRGASLAWVAPRLVRGLVQQTLWEVRLPSSRALVGVPAGWADENEWYWDRYVWKRRPWQSAVALAAWASGSTVPSKAADTLVDETRSDEHGYLFSRPGPPIELHPWIASRAGLVAVCSGSVLAIGGFLILFRRPPARLAWATALAMVLTGATAVQPSVTFLAIQSAMIGVVFILLMALMDRLVQRRRHPVVFGESGALAAPPVPGSSLNRAIGAGSDDSTAIRGRPSSTVDHVVTGAATPPEILGGRSSRVERSG